MEQSGKLGTIGNKSSGRSRSKKRASAELAAGEIHSRRGKHFPIQEPATNSPRRASCSPPARVAQKPHTKTRDDLAAVRFCEKIRVFVFLSF